MIRDLRLEIKSLKNNQLFKNIIKRNKPLLQFKHSKV